MNNETNKSSMVYLDKAWIEDIKKEAINRGFVPGVYFKSTAKINLTYTGAGDLTWNMLANSLWFSGSGGCVYDATDNTWATIIIPAPKKQVKKKLWNGLLDYLSEEQPVATLVIASLILTYILSRTILYFTL